MFTICISSSNIVHAKDNSTSFKTCKLVTDMIHKRLPNKIDTAIISLVDYELKPCIGCGHCIREDRCINDDSFDRIYEQLTMADALFIVSPHYAPIPAKLSMLLEKIEQLAFLKRFNNEQYRSPLFGKPLGIIAHGGGTEEIIKYYKVPVLDTITNALSFPVEMKIIGVDSNQPNGVTFPVKNVKKTKDSIFPIQEYDWKDIENRLAPFVDNVLDFLSI